MQTNKPLRCLPPPSRRPDLLGEGKQKSRRSGCDVKSGSGRLRLDFIEALESQKCYLTHQKALNTSAIAYVLHWDLDIVTALDEHTHTHTERELLKGWFRLDSVVAGVIPLRLLLVTRHLFPPSKHTHTHTHLYVDLSSNARAGRTDKTQEKNVKRFIESC